MAFVVDNGSLTDITVKSNTGESSAEVQVVEMARTSGGVTFYIAKAGGAAWTAGDTGLPVFGVYKSSPALDSGVVSGDVSPLTVDGTGYLYTNIGSMPGSSSTTDSVSAVFQSGYVMVGNTAYAVNHYNGSLAAAGSAQTLVAASGSLVHKVIALRSMCGGTATDITYFSNATQVHKTTPGVNGGEVLPFNPHGWFQSVAGEELKYTTGAGSTTQLTMKYISY